MTSIAGAAVASPTRPWAAERVELWPAEKLIPYANNPRLHSAADIDRIAAAGGVFFSGFSATIASVVTSMCRGTNGSNPSPSSGESDEIEDGLKSSYAADLKLRGSVSFHRRQDNPALPIL